MALPDDDVTKRRPGKTAQARRLRLRATEEECDLWSDLRNRRLSGYKFARQVPLGFYVVDFLCRDRRLVIEVDGFHHADRPADTARTAWLNRNGYSQLRFWNQEVTRERDAVLDTILAVLTGAITEQCGTIRFHPSLRTEHKENEEQRI